MGQRVGAQFRIRVGAQQGPARVVEVHPARPARGVIQRFAQRVEIGDAARMGVERRRIAVHRKAAAVEPVASVEH